MSNQGKNIKTYSHYLWIFIAINFVVYLCFVLNKDFNFDFINETYKVINNSIIAIFSTLITFILNGLLTSNFKATLVFWKTKNSYPGFRIFTKHMYKDCRIDRAILIKKYGELPVEPREQNKLWYKIFKSYEFDPMVFNSHRNFLLSRDLTGLSFLFLIIYSIASIISKIIFSIQINLLLMYISILILQYLILAIVSQNYGIRFACNVLAKASLESNS